MQKEPDGQNPCWDNASRCWRGAFFQKGVIINRTGTDDYYVSLGLIGKLLVAAWKVTKLKLHRNKYAAFAVGTGRDRNCRATLISPIDLDDYEGVPTDIVSPIHLWLANSKSF